jgi:hypothetical protein
MTKYLGNYKTASDVARMIELREKNKIKNVSLFVWDWKEFFTALFIWAVIFLCFFALSGCGSDNKRAVSYSGIVWEGYVNQNADTKDQYTKIKSCLSHIGENRNDKIPYLIITKGTMNCGGQQAYGCADFDTNTIFIDNEIPINHTNNLGHEVVHIVAQRKDENFTHGELVCSIQGICDGCDI